jgi:caa(3)-type oxidase subunit IV
MSDNTEHSHPDYWKIYKWLLLLFAISVLGPALFPGIKFIVLLTAFGIAIVKALLVAGNFMHLNIERKYIWHLFLICLVFLLVLFAGTASDVLNKKGNNWEREAFTGVFVDLKKSDTKKSDTKKSDTKKSDTKKSDTKKSDTKKSDTKKPDTKKPDTKKPDTKKPDTKKPDTKKPDTKKPDPKLVAQGKILFQTKICFTCHQTDPAVPAPAGLALKAPPFTGSFWGKEREVQLDADPTTPAYDPGGKIVKVKLDEAYFMESVEKPFAKIFKGAIPGMAPLPTTPEERKALAAYVKSLSK